MPLLYQTNQRLLVFGQTGRGKSEFLKRIIVPAINKFLIFDAKYEYSGFGRVAHNISELRALVKTKGVLKIVFQPLRDSNLNIAFEEVSKFILDYLRDLVFIVDEFQLVAPEGNVPPSLMKILTLGRSSGIGFIGATQRAQLITKTALTQAEHIIIFYVSSKDLEYLSKYFGEGVKQLETLPAYHYIYCNSGKTEVNTPV
jgi:DNA helicase HerA-like ATPase